MYDYHRAGPCDQDMWDYAEYLREIAHGAILEIGAGYGVSTTSFLFGVEENGGHVYTVDLHDDCPGAKLYQGNPQWTFILANSATQVGLVRSELPEFLDVLFIDGDHSYQGVVSDLENYVPLVKPGGLILLHDVQPCPEIVDWVTQGGIHGPWEPFQAFEDFTQAHPTWFSEIKPGRCGLGVIKKG